MENRMAMDGAAGIREGDDPPSRHETQSVPSPTEHLDSVGMMKPIAPSLELMDEAIAKHKPVAVFGLFSGGHDSLTATHIAAQHPKFTAAVHINTGIGIEETREFVRETCKREGWPLKEYRAVDLGQDYRAMVLEQGFPGPTKVGHGIMYNRLKERCLRALIRDTKKGIHDRVLLVSGCRSQESQRRMGNVEPIQEEGVRIWTAIIHDWTKAECNEYIDGNKIPRNLVVDLIHKSGECLCGAYARKGELDELALWFPKVAAEIRELQKEVRAAGFPWDWEDGPPKWFVEKRKGQEMLFDMEMLCQSCPNNGS